jgi:hypothetical protein
MVIFYGDHFFERVVTLSLFVKNLFREIFKFKVVLGSSFSNLALQPSLVGGA